MENLRSKIHFMNFGITTLHFPNLTALFLVLLYSLQVHGAETKTITYTTTEGPVVSRAVLTPGIRPGHELVQASRTNMTSSGEADWNDSPVTTFSQTEVTNGTGTTSGYAIRNHKNGDKTYYRFRGTFKAVGEGTSRESVGEGTVELTGGTGKFANATGTGTFSNQGGVIKVKLTVTY